jgi:hypothetical protein
VVYELCWTSIKNSVLVLTSFPPSDFFEIWALPILLLAAHSALCCHVLHPV